MLARLKFFVWTFLVLLALTHFGEWLVEKAHGASSQRVGECKQEVRWTLAGAEGRRNGYPADVVWMRQEELKKLLISAGVVETNPAGLMYLTGKPWPHEHFYVRLDDETEAEQKQIADWVAFGWKVSDEHQDLPIDENFSQAVFEHCMNEIKS